MTAETLREAAKRMRERAAVVPAGPWGTVEGTMGQLGEVIVVYGAKAEGADNHPQVVTDWGMERGPAAEYVASWHPDVALAIADLLDIEADMASESGPGWAVDEAIAVARAYLGSES